MPPKNSIKKFEEITHLNHVNLLMEMDFSSGWWSFGFPLTPAAPFERNFAETFWCLKKYFITAQNILKSVVLLGNMAARNKRRTVFFFIRFNLTLGSKALVHVFYQLLIIIVNN